MKRDVMSRGTSEAQSSLYLAISSLVVLISGFLIPISFARWATQESYGQFSYVISLMGLLNLFCLPGMNDAISQGIARDEKGIWWAALKTRLRWTSLGVAVLLAIGTGFFLGKHPLGLVFLLLSPFLVTYVLDSTKAFLSGQMAFRTLACVNVGSNILPVLTVVSLLALGHQSALWTSLGYFVTLFSFYTLVFFMILVFKRPQGNFSQKTLRYGKHMSLVSSLGAFQAYIDKVIVGSLLGFTDLALYSVASLFQNPIKLLSWGVLYPLLLPSYAKISASDLQRETRRWLKRTAFFGGIGFCASFLLVAPFLALAFGKAYQNVAPYAALLILSGFCLIPGMIFDIALRSRQMNAEIYLLRIGQVLITVLSLLVFIPIFSLMGAVLADLVSNFLYTLFGFFLYLRIGKELPTNMNWKPLLLKYREKRLRWDLKRQIQKERRMREGLTENGGLMEYPSHFIFELTMKCNLRCKMCFYDFVREAEENRDKQELTTEQIKNIVEEISPYMRSVTLVGAEVTLRKDFLTILQMLDQKGAQISMTTNGTLFTEEYYRVFKGLKQLPQVGISLDGPKEAHDLIRGKGRFEKSVSTIRRLTSELHVPVTVVTVVMKETLPYLEEMVKLAGEIGAKTISFEYERNHTHADLEGSQRLMQDFPMNFSVVAHEDKPPGFSLEELKETLGHVRKTAYSRGIQLQNIPPLLEESADRFYDRDHFLDHGENFCIRLRSGRIDPYGNVITCFNIKTSFGNLLEKSFKEIWNGDSYRTFRKRLVATNLLPICKACPYARLVKPKGNSSIV